MWKGYILNYDYDPKAGYTETSIHTTEYYQYQNTKTGKQKIIVNLYVEDIKDLLSGTGIDLDD